MADPAMLNKLREHKAAVINPLVSIADFRPGSPHSQRLATSRLADHRRSRTPDPAEDDKHPL